jgi:hypothetical protein
VIQSSVPAWSDQEISFRAHEPGRRILRRGLVISDTETTGSMNDLPQICICGHPMSVHAYSLAAGHSCLNQKSPCFCTTPIAALEVSDIIFFDAECTLAGTGHALVKGINASTQGGGRFRFIIPLKCMLCENTGEVCVVAIRKNGTNSNTTQFISVIMCFKCGASPILGPKQALKKKIRPLVIAEPEEAINPFAVTEKERYV